MSRVRCVSGDAWPLAAAIMNISQAATVTGGWPQWGRGLLGIIWQEQDECVEMILCVKIVEWRSDVWGRGQGHYKSTATLSPHISSRSKKINGITLIGKRNLYKTASIDNLETSISEDRKQIFEIQWASTFCPASFKDKTKINKNPSLEKSTVPLFIQMN